MKRICYIMLIMSLAGMARAGTYTRQNNATTLNQAGAWSAGGPPGVGDAAQWNNTSAGNYSTAIGASVNWGQIIIANPGSAITIGNTAGAVLTLNGISGTGIDMSAATQNLTINDITTLAGDQTWNVNASRILNAAYYISGAYGIIKNGAGDLQLNSTAISNYGDGQVNQFSGVTIISGGKIILYNSYNGAGGVNYSALGLQKSVYDTTGSSSSLDVTAAGILYLWLGGLTGNVNLATAVNGYGAITGLYLNPQAGVSATYGAVIANGGANMQLLKLGPGIQTLTATETYTGATTIYAGTLALSGASGTSQSSAFTVKGGTLSLDNSGGAWADRLADGTAISLGSLTLKSYNGAGIQAETNGATTLATSGKITIDIGGGTDQTTLALGNVTRSAGAAIDFVGVDGTLGGGVNCPNVTSSSWPALANGILPWGTVNGTNWAATGANGIVAYFGTFVDPTSAASDATKNAQLTGSGTMGSAKSFNSLNVITSGAGQSMSLTGGNLTLTSPGAILKSGTDSYTISSSSGNITAGTELIAHVDGGDLTISAPLNTAILNIAKGGTGKLILSGTRVATLSGNIGIAGTLELQGLTTTISGPISGPGGLTINLNAGQVLTISSASSSFSGPVLVKGGILKLNAWNAPGLSYPPCCGVPWGAAGGLNNVELNGGILALPYHFSRYLGPGPDQIQITGGTSGFASIGVSPLYFNGQNQSNYEIVWGSPYFQPTTLVLGDSAVSTATITIPNLIDLNGSTRTISNSSAYAGILSGVIRTSSGTAGLAKTGVGELQLTAANTYNGVVTVDGGILTVSSLANGGSNSGLGTSSSAAANLLLANGTTFKYTGGSVNCDRGFTINGTTAGDSASLDASGSAALVLTATGSPAYGTAGQTRTLILTGTAAYTNTLCANIADNGSGAVSVTKTGAGTWVLTGANTHTGTNILSAGELVVSSANNLGAASAKLVFNGGALGITNTALTKLSDLGRTIVFNSGAAVGLDIANAANTFTVDQSIAASAGFTKSGAGTLVFSTNNSYTGSTTINGGTLQLNDGVGMPLTTLIINGGTFMIGKNGTVTQGIDFPSSISGAGSLAYTGNGTLILNSSNNLYTGTTRASSANSTIKLSHNLAIQNSAIDTTSTGAFSLDTGVTGPTFGGLSGATGNIALVITNGYGSVTNLILNPSGTVTYGGVIADGTAGMTLTMAGTGTQVLQGVNTYSGSTLVYGGTLTLNRQTGSIPAGGALTFGGTGTFNMDNVGASGALSQTLGALTFSNGEATVKITRTAAQNALLTFSSLSRSNGATGTFLISAGAASASHGFVVGGVTPNTFIDKGVFYGVSSGDSYAWYDTGSFVRAMAYPGDAGTATSAGGASLASVTHQQITGAITAQNNATFTTFKISGANNVTLAAGQTVTVDGILKSGNNAATITGGTGIQASSGAELVIRTDQGSDNLTIRTNILDNSGNSLTKCGAGTLVLSAPNAYTGKTRVLAGTIRLGISGTTGIGLTSAGVPGPLGAPAAGPNATIDLYAGTTLSTGGTSPRVNQTTDRTVNLAGGPGTVSIQVTDNDTVFQFGSVTATGVGAKTLALFTGFGGSGDREELTFTGTIADSADGSPTSLQATYRTQSSSSSCINLVAGATFTGSITLIQGASVVNSYLVVGGRLNRTGGNNSFNNTPGSGQLNSGNYAGNVSLGATTVFYYDSSANQVLSGVISGVGGLTKDATGTLTLSGANTYSGDTTISAGTLVLSNQLAIQNSKLNYTAGALNFAAFTNFTFGALSGTQAFALTNIAGNAVALTAGGNGSNTTYSGIISGSGSLIKAGGGTMTLSVNNTYTGSTMVNGGVLTLNNACLSSLSPVYIASGANVNLSFTGTNTIKSLYFGGVGQPAGIYGLNYLGGATYFSGNGALNVTEGPDCTIFLIF